MKTFLIHCAIVLGSIFAPAKGMILSSLALITIDLVTGILASRKQGDPITSAKLQRTIVKLAVYEVAILLGFIAEHYLIGDSIPISRMIAGYIGMVELTSCLENINVIGGNNLLATIIKKLGSKNE